MHFIVKALFAALIAFFFHVKSHAQQTSIRVENGTSVTAKNDLSRSIALLILGKSGICSATFLTPKILLSAAHCTSMSTAKETYVNLRDENGKWWSVKVVRMLSHPDYHISESKNGTRVKNDVGLLEIEYPFHFEVFPLKISSVKDLKKNEAVTIAGYGFDSADSGSGVLRTGTMRAQVIGLYPFYGREGLYMVNANDQWLCPGDSGGAVLRKTEKTVSLIGVNSLSSGCMGATNASSMSEIADHHYAWIKKMAPSVP